MKYLFIQIIDLAKDHLANVKEECSAYREICKSAQQNLKDIFTSAEIFQPPGPGSMIAPLTNRTTMHYSFDMAQQVKIFVIITIIV